MDKSGIQALITKASNLELELVWIPRIIERQTDDEVLSRATKYSNRIGLNSSDASFVTAIYKKIKSGKNLSDIQSDETKKRLQKYWRQYLVMSSCAEVKI